MKRALGYNGFPRGVKDSEERYANRELKYRLVMHAEMNTILNANKTRGCRMYVYPTLMMPAACPECAKAIVQSGITELVYYHKENVEDRWQVMADATKILLEEGGVKTRVIR